MSWRGILRKAGMTSDGVNININGVLTHSGGVIPAGMPFGNSWYVDYRNGADTNSGKKRNRAFKTYSAAISACTTNNNDVIYIDGDSTVVETAMVNITKSRVHTVGVNGPPGFFGAGAKISCALASGATNIATVQNTGVRNTFTGIKFINGNTVDEGLYSVAEGGEYTRYFNCEIYKSTDLDVALAADLLMNGDSSQFFNCVIGSLVDEVDTAGAGSKQRPRILLTRETLTGKVARDFVFHNCLILTKAGHVDVRFVYGVGATTVERMGLFDQCQFWNAKLAAAVPAENVDFSAAQTQGEVLLRDCVGMNAATAMGTQTGIFVIGNSPTAGTAGIAVQAT